MKTVLSETSQYNLNYEPSVKESLKAGLISKKKKFSKLDAAAFNFSDMFSFRDENDGNTNLQNDQENVPQENESSNDKSRFQSLKKSKKLAFKASSFFHAKPLQSSSASNAKANTSNSTGDSSTSKRYSSPARKARNSMPKGVLITEELISRVCKTADQKEKLDKKDFPETYCHQCRIKSADTKTVCHSEDCNKGRGMLCGVCLNMWYNEDAAEALRNKEWVCPSCRGICECALCRDKRGLHPLPKTVASTALMLGFSSVKQYLQSREN
ncbi:uncharacterized protein LOC142342145 [Convolutriloba macropyga]|uniref:uncharacterized protein LOC142342145 n=1 Tax=Convolutriloba macropyga TaxID=536237 RepID=UPI003F527DF6